MQKYFIKTCNMQQFMKVIPTSAWEHSKFKVLYEAKLK